MSRAYRAIVKFCFNLMSIFWMTSPLSFILLRKGLVVFDSKYDWFICGVLSLISFLTMGLTYRTWENDEEEAS